MSFSASVCPRPVKRTRPAAFWGVFVIAFLTAFVWGLKYWFYSNFGAVTIEQILFFLNVPLQGTDPTIITSFIFFMAVLPCLAGFLLAMVLVPDGLRFIRKISWKIRKTLRSAGRIPAIRRGITILGSIWLWLGILGILLLIPCFSRSLTPTKLPLSAENSRLMAAEKIPPCLLCPQFTPPGNDTAHSLTNTYKDTLTVIRNVDCADAQVLRKLTAAHPQPLVEVPSIVAYNTALRNGIDFPAMMLESQHQCRLYRILKYHIRNVTASADCVRRNLAVVKHLQKRGVTVLIYAATPDDADFVKREFPAVIAIDRAKTTL